MTIAASRPALLTGLSLTSLVLNGAIFGFFYAWVCSTMWGLDAADPRIAIGAMQAMNASVRNAVFFPAFFLTGPVLLITAVIAARAGRRASAQLFAAAGLLYVLGGTILTMAVNVPMNEALALVDVPATLEQARAVWADYSGPWQVFNQIRTVASGVALGLTGLALLRL
ncbi:DUF1772 domain-containing protein [Pseudooceanicola onchidii]|uniref:anthrone oxygenase family protein n=1 Tax=Pseudooceanicola onchidii TaxID=2562279 RepID=UPI0010AA5BD3|nr:anthrone oxygenase family protein [Pseudooceanicola onchidii]